MKEDQEVMEVLDEQETESEVETFELTFFNRLRRKLDFGFFYALQEIPPFRAIYADLYVLSRQVSSIGDTIISLGTEIQKLRKTQNMILHNLRKGSTNTELPDFKFDKSDNGDKHKSN